MDTSNIDENPSLPDPTEVVFLSPFERRGVIAMAFAGTVSCVFVTSLLLTIILPALFTTGQNSKGPSTPFTSKQIAVFVICLLCSDLIQSISGLIQVKWAVENSLSEGTACSIQAATLVLGDLGSTVWSCVIAAHTFSSLALMRQWSRKTVVSTVITGWAFVIILTAFGPLALTRAGTGPFFSIAGTWCFISSEYAVARLVIHYIPLFIAAVVIVIFYGIVCLVLLRSISFTRGPYPSLPFSDEATRRRVIIAKRMLWYPIVYLTCVLPISITRIIGMKSDNVPEGVWVFSMFFLFSLGAADSVVYATTRNMIRPKPLPARLTVFNDTRSSWAVNLSHIKTPHEQDFDIDATVAYPPDMVDQAPPVPQKDSIKDLHLDSRRYGTHITLDHTQEVILVSLGRIV